MKISVLIPAYNVAKTINKCLDSILSFKDEKLDIIVLNDASFDNLDEVIVPYLDKITYIKNDKNEGIAKVRNKLIKKVKSDYFLFVDSDDYIDPLVFNHLFKAIKNNPDIVTFQIREESVDKEIIRVVSKPIGENIKGEDFLCSCINMKTTFDTPVAYLYKTSYFKKNKFLYKEGHRHEDFGLTPLVLAYANKITSLDYVGYFYVQNSQSETRGDEERIRNNAYDMLYHFDYLKEEIEKSNKVSDNTKKYFNSFLANSLLGTMTTLNLKDQKDFVKKLRKRNVANMLLSNNIKRKIKKIIVLIRYQNYKYFL